MIKDSKSDISIYGKLRNFLNKKNILIISPNFWGNVHITKHHYAIELHRLGANIFYLNPPSRSFGGFFKTTEIFENFKVIDFQLHIPGRLKNYLPWLYYYYMGFMVKRISAVANNDIFLSVDFSRDLPYSLTKENYFNAKHKIFFPVDNPHTDYIKKSKNISDMYFSISKDILKMINMGKHYHYCLGHSVSSDFFSEELMVAKCNSKSINIGYVGNLFMDNIDYDTIIELVRENKKTNFHFIGPNEASSINNNLGVQKNNFEKIKILKGMSNTIFHGILYKKLLIQLLRKMDAMFLCYFEFGSHPAAPVNSHKILEFLALGKVVISNYFEDYKSYNNDLIFMPRKNHTSNQYIRKFKLIISELHKFNEDALLSRRRDFAKGKTYEISTKILLEKIKENI